MSDQITTPINDWEKELEVKLSELKTCQNKKNFQSCSQCSEFFECFIRRAYINAVYASMNKGSSGGFEF